MPQNADKVIDHEMLFREPEYQELFANKKREFEFNHADDKVAEIRDWTKTKEYKDKNFAREALTVNPAKACQPLGAVFVANGFARTMSFVHGSQGCVAYYRSHFSRHFKEPTSCVSSSMTEDAAVFGGLNNMIDGLANTYNLYKPEMIAVSTTCMAEVIGDDLNAFIKSAKEKGSVPAEFDVPFAHTPAFVGSHVTGYDNALLGVLQHFWDGKSGTVPPLERKPGESINFIGGFDGFVVGNMKEIRRIFDLFGADYTVLCDPSEVWNTPTDGEFRMYEGGTTKEEVERALHAKATIVFQEYSCEKTIKYLREKGQDVVVLNSPIGVAGTDAFVMALSRLTGKPVPAQLEKERGQLVDAMADSQAQRAVRRPRHDARPHAVPARARRRAGPRAVHQRQRRMGGQGAGHPRRLALRQGLPGPSQARPVAHALAAQHRAGGLPDRQHLRQVPGARHRHAADPHGVPDLRPPPLPPLPDLGLRRRAARADHAARRVLRDAGRQHHRRGQDRLLVRHHPLSSVRP
jgi:nitrogenase molybdenum-iron protein beta subunit